MTRLSDATMESPYDVRSDDRSSEDDDDVTEVVLSLPESTVFSICAIAIWACSSICAGVFGALGAAFPLVGVVPRSETSGSTDPALAAVPPPNSVLRSEIPGPTP